LEEGSASSHTAIICRAIGIPLIGRAEGVLDKIEVGDPVLVDGEKGSVYAITLDGQLVSLQLNAGLLVDLPQLDQAGADGIGLFRTEFQFMVSEFMPRLKEQTELPAPFLTAKSRARKN